jgi:hypothetical protein
MPAVCLGRMPGARYTKTQVWWPPPPFGAVLFPCLRPF